MLSTNALYTPAQTFSLLTPTARLTPRLVVSFIKEINEGRSIPTGMKWPGLTASYKMFTFANTWDPMLAYCSPYGEYTFTDGSSAGLSEINGKFYAYPINT